MKHMWLYLSRNDIEVEHQQCEEEGRDLSSVEDEFAKVLSLDLEDLSNQAAAQALLDKTIELPLRSGYEFVEPSDLQSIRAARPQDRPQLAPWKGSDAELLDKLHGAWSARVAGCLLGKPVEGWHRPRFYSLLKETDNWPLRTYLRRDTASSEAQEKHCIAADNKASSFADLVEKSTPRAAPIDDDTNYTTTGLAILQRYGADFSPANVAEFWMQDMPLFATCTAERVAYRNFCNLVSAPHSASFRNPYREWIGAQIRADFWGYANPGNPERAAEWAWRDASISHVKNGIYGEMWAAAMIAASFVTEDIEAIIRAGLGEIPVHCRLADAIKKVLSWHHDGISYDEACEKIHGTWDETRAHDWCHTISNAMIVTLGLLWGEGDFAKTICRAVQPAFDTDCNGATTGSIVGIISGRKNLDESWIETFGDRLRTSVAGYPLVELSQMARETAELVGKYS
jgi:ADP-ribosylglycohydrolase